MARDYPYPKNPMSAVEKKIWTKLKVFFFCEEDESLHWTDVAWLAFGGLFVLIGLFVALS